MTTSTNMNGYILLLQNDGLGPPVTTKTKTTSTKTNSKTKARHPKKMTSKK